MKKFYVLTAFLSTCFAWKQDYFGFTLSNQRLHSYCEDNDKFDPIHILK